MKRFLSLLMVLVLALSLCACGDSDKDKENETVVLTLDNINSYLDINTSVKSCTTNEGQLMLPWASSEGEAEIVIETQNDSGVTFKKATITCEVKILGSGNYGWEFVSGNIESANRGTSKVDCNANSKKIKIDLPYDGEESVTEKLKMAIYTDDDYVMATELTNNSGIMVEIIDVVGTVEE